MPPIPRSAQHAPARRAASAAMVAVIAVLASGCGDTIVGSTEDVREELLVVRSTPALSHTHFAWMAPDGSELHFDPEGIDHRSISVSPDREWVAFRSLEPGLEMKRMRTDGTGMTGLDTPSLSHTPHWSPDGTRVLFAEGIPPVGGAVYLMNADGSGRRMLEDNGVLPNRFFNSSNPWSPDGRRVAFLAAAGESIVVFEVDGPGRTEIEVSDAWRSMSWSRDGRIAFSAGQGDSVALFVADPGTGGVTQVTPAGERVQRAFWVPAR